MKQVKVIFVTLLGILVIIFTIKNANWENREQIKNDVIVTQLLQSDNDLGVECSDEPLVTYFQQYYSFLVFYNFVKANRHFRCYESITFTTLADYRYLDNLEGLVERWQGPISVAVHAPGYDFNMALKAIAYLRLCTTPLIKEFVSFHLFFDEQHLPPKQENPLLKSYEDEYNCTDGPPFKKVKEENTYKKRYNVSYPINASRNIAMKAAQTYFILPIDIELFPNANFIDKFLSLVRRRKSFFDASRKHMYVLPIFEVASNHAVPENKTELARMYGEGTAIRFHKNTCPKCHMIPDEAKWMAQPEDDEINVFSIVKKKKSNYEWEPIVLCTKHDPIFDNRFVWDTAGDKLPQAFELCLQDYDFVILDNAFLAHKPGFKKALYQMVHNADKIKESWKLKNKVFRELVLIYGTKENCDFFGLMRNYQP